MDTPIGALLTHHEIRARRKRLGWSQEKLARNAGLSLMTIFAIENGKGMLLDTYQKIVQALQSGENEEN